MTPHSHGLDPRVWLAWGAAASLPMLMGRHPVVIAELLIIVLTVRAVCLPPSRVAGWGWLLRLGMLAVPIGIVFNVLTVHSGESELFRMPERLPIVGGSITLNALVYGVLSGLAIVALVATGVTVAAALDWSALVRLVPPRAASLAVAGSVAWSFLPQLATSWREIREAQAARGHRFRGARDAPPLIVPLLAGGLGRSVTMAEVLESRGFGGIASRSTSSTRSAVTVTVAVTVGVLAVYLLAVGRPMEGLAALVVSIGLAAIGMRRAHPDRPHRITRYRTASWQRADTIVATGVLVAVIATILALQIDPESLRYDPYPELTWPSMSLWLITGFALLLAPAVVAPAAPERTEVES